MIRVENVTKYYAVGSTRRYILSNASFVIPSNSNVAILGGNGAGKSTLLRLIGGAETPNKGRIVSDCNISWPLGLSSGFQGSLSGRDNVMFVCRINGLSHAESKQVIAFVIDFSELGNYFEMPTSTYSSGMRARLTFGLSMIFKFDVYLIDELTSVGDMKFRAKAQKAFDELRERASLIFVSHNMKTLKDSCESALVLKDGNATFFENIDEGIKVYTESVKSTEKDETKKGGEGKTVGSKPATKMATKLATKMATKMARKMATQMARKMATQMARKMATKMAKKLAKKNELLDGSNVRGAAKENFVMKKTPPSLKGDLKDSEETKLE